MAAVSAAARSKVRGRQQGHRAGGRRAARPRRPRRPHLARDEPAAHEVVERIRKDGGRAFALHAPLGRHGQRSRRWITALPTALSWRPVAFALRAINDALAAQSTGMPLMTRLATWRATAAP